MTTKVREITTVGVGLLLAPVAPALFLPLLTPLVSGPDYPPYALAHVAFFYLASLEASLVLALPSYALLQKLSLVRWWSAVLVGAFVGFVVAVLFNDTGVTPRLSLSWSAAGAIGAFVFWAIWCMGLNAAQPHNGEGRARQSRARPSL